MSVDSDIKDPIEYVKMIVHKMKLPKQDFDDHVGDGLMGYLKAIELFKPELGFKFRTYADQKVRFAVLDAIRERRGRKGQKDIFELWETSKDRGNIFEEVEAEDYDPNTLFIVEDIIKSLGSNEKELKVVRMALEGYKVHEIATELGVSGSRVSQIKEKIREGFGLHAKYNMEEDDEEIDYETQKSYSEGLEEELPRLRARRGRKSDENRNLGIFEDYYKENMKVDALMVKYQTGEQNIRRILVMMKKRATANGEEINRRKPGRVASIKKPKKYEVDRVRNANIIKDRYVHKMSVEDLATKYSLSTKSILPLITRMKRKKSIQEYISECNGDGYVPPVPEPRKNSVKVSEELEVQSLPSLSEVEKDHILKTINHYHGNKTRATKSLGISIKTLYNKLKEYGIEL